MALAQRFIAESESEIVSHMHEPVTLTLTSLSTPESTCPAQRTVSLREPQCWDLVCTSVDLLVCSLPLTPASTTLPTPGPYNTNYTLWFTIPIYHMERCGRIWVPSEFPVDLQRLALASMLMPGCRCGIRMNKKNVCTGMTAIRRIACRRGHQIQSETWGPEKEAPIAGNMNM